MSIKGPGGTDDYTIGACILDDRLLAISILDLASNLEWQF